MAGAARHQAQPRRHGALCDRVADDRNFVKKGVSWALRGIGRLAASPEPAAPWVGKGALRDLTRPAVVRRVKSR